MSTIYHVVLPNNQVLKLPVQPSDERMKCASDVLHPWEPYCNRGWLSVNHEDVFCTEKRVKRFLDGLGYYLILGQAEGVVSEYKAMMNGTREIPISSCPALVSDTVYGDGYTIKAQESKIEYADVDEKKNAVKPERQADRRKPMDQRKKNLSDLQRSCGRNAELRYQRVDTDNVFELDGQRYRISESVEAYAPKVTALGSLYDMDKIVCVKCKDGTVKFYDAGYNPIDDQEIEKI